MQKIFPSKAGFAPYSARFIAVQANPLWNSPTSARATLLSVE